MLVKCLLAKLLLVYTLLACVPLSHAQAEALPLDLIELLGELDDDENALDAAITEIEIKKTKEITQPNEVKK